MAIAEEIKAKLIRPIIDSWTGIILVPTGTIGDVLDFNITPGPRAYIPTSGLFDAELTRRIVFTIQFPQGVYQVVFPEAMEFLAEWGLLKALMTAEKIAKIESMSPTPTFRSSVVRPFAVTIVLENGLRLTLIVDKTSGILDLELEAEAS